MKKNQNYIDETMPWALAKENETEKLKSCMYHLIENLREIAILIRPFMTQTAENIFRQIGIEKEELKTWDSINKYDNLKGINVIGKGEPIFMRLNVEEEVEYIKNIMKS